jgi:2-oxoisovalerate dehydrogenase E2 component (dihydrolipoyl transacylase)
MLPRIRAHCSVGIRECEIIQWFVAPDARVEEFDKICEVQSDKASVEITSRFTGVIKKLHYESGEMAIVGKPLVDIDIEDNVEDKDLGSSPSQEAKIPLEAENPMPPSSGDITPAEKTSKLNQDLIATTEPVPQHARKGTHAALATPAVRHLTKELGVSIEDVDGTGRDGRVTKDDVYKFAEARKSASATQAESEPQGAQPAFSSPSSDDGPQKETAVQLTNIQSQMFKAMTLSLKIPHFLYTDEVDFSNLTHLRHRLNKSTAKSSSSDATKLSFLPFIIKAVSLALHQYPILNARVDINSSTSKPSLIMRNQHNIGIAMDTPQGLLVPIIKNVSSLAIPAIASELNRLQSLASAGKLTTADLAGGTITISNIGSIGGTYVSPVIVEKEVAILGIGKVRSMPAFGPDGNSVVKKQVAHFSWSADHRVVDGATMARAAEVVRAYVEEPDRMLVNMR